MHVPNAWSDRRRRRHGPPDPTARWSNHDAMEWRTMRSILNADARVMRTQNKPPSRCETKQTDRNDVPMRLETEPHRRRKPVDLDVEPDERSTASSTVVPKHGGWRQRRIVSIWMRNPRISNNQPSCRVRGAERMAKQPPNPGSGRTVGPASTMASISTRTEHRLSREQEGFCWCALERDDEKCEAPKLPLPLHPWIQPPPL
mmetsp:Transcript_1035/g.6559  ORF Transcript_1035/g.6559 Transcript_1035/m.6559 type:complete len:202 (+) Transcript_1035:92-697(+)